MMTVTIDQELCIGCGCCESMASIVFYVNDRGKAVVVGEVPQSEEKAVRDAAENCPARAINISDGR